MTAPVANPSLARTPELGRWAVPAPVRRRLVFRTGKVEIGQHIHAALRRLAADACGLAPEFVEIADVSTAESPDEGLTAGSLSVQHSGTAVFAAATCLRGQLHSAAARRLNCAPEALRLDPATAMFHHDDSSCDLFDLVPELDLDLPVPPVQPVADPDHPLIGTDAPVPRIAGTIMGKARYIQDLRMDGMLHARAMRGIDPDRLPAAEGLIEVPGGWILREGGFCAVAATSEHGLERLWSEILDQVAEREPTANPHDGPVEGWCRSVPVESFSVDAPQGAPAPGTSTRRFSFIASRGFLLHSSIAPSCALALWQAGRLEVWSHSQGVFQLRAAMARALDMPDDRITLHHVESAGCYGHNPADDAAMDAALIARAFPGRPVRTIWARRDEMRHGPVGAPMSVTVSAGLDDAGRIVGWSDAIWSGSHGQRPGAGGAVNLLGAIERTPSLRPERVGDVAPAVGSGAARNAIPPYGVPLEGIEVSLFQDLPVRSSSLRSLGAHVNVAAIEAMIEILAEAAGADPVEFRLRHLEDARAREVVTRMGAAAQALRAGVSDEGTEAVGVGYSRYKNSSALAGVAVQLRLEDEPRLLRAHAVVDAGLIVMPDAARAQVEGGIVQAASWTLREGKSLRNGRIDCEGWEGYPIFGWADIPDIEVEFLSPDDPARPPLGVGECMQGPVAAAIINALGSLLGARCGRMPLNRDRILELMA